MHLRPVCTKFLTKVILSNLDTNIISLNVPWFVPCRCPSLEFDSNCVASRHSWLEQHLILRDERLGQVELLCRGDKHKDVCTLQFIESDLPPHSVSYCFLNLDLSKEKKIDCTFKRPCNQNQWTTSVTWLRMPHRLYSECITDLQTGCWGMSLHRIKICDNSKGPLLISPSQAAV